MEKGGFPSNQTWAVYRQKELHSLITKEEEVIWGDDLGYSTDTKDLLEWFELLGETKKKQLIILF